MPQVWNLPPPVERTQGIGKNGEASASPFIIFSVVEQVRRVLRASAGQATDAVFG